jgi:hypothetical protein
MVTFEIPTLIQNRDIGNFHKFLGQNFEGVTNAITTLPNLLKISDWQI